jgi:hypothetical protein
MKKKTRDEENKKEKNMKKRTVEEPFWTPEYSSRRRWHERQEPKFMIQSYRAEARENSTSTEEKTKAYATQMENKKSAEVGGGRKKNDKK